MAEQIRSTYKALPMREGIRAYSELRQSVIGAGLLDRQYSWYLFHIAGISIGFFSSLLNVYIVNNLWLAFFWSLVFAFFTVQYGGIVHDGGHRAIFKSTILNDIIGQIAGGFIALGFSEWREKHNKHHAHTNEIEEDPDIDIPLLSFTEERLREKTGIQKLLGKFQVYFYYPMGLSSSAFMRLANLKYIKENWKDFGYWGEFLIWISAMIIWFAGPFIFFPFWKAVIVFITIHAATGFYMMHIFAPNHKGMPEIEKNVEMSFIERQIITSRNVKAHWLTDFLYMGLNYQIEHHLFPNTPRPNLGKVSAFIKRVCKKYGWEYSTCTVIEQDKIILGELVEMTEKVYGTKQISS